MEDISTASRDEEFSRAYQIQGGCAPKAREHLYFSLFRIDEPSLLICPPTFYILRYISNKDLVATL